MSDLSIVTKHTSTENATKINYDRNGKIISETLTARETGTTVSLQNLFSTLPVRRKEFTKNLKREFNKMCQLLYAYCLVSKGIKFSCTNTTNKGSKNIIVATEGLNTVKDNIINVFGPKQIASLIEVEMVRPDETILAEYGLQLSEEEALPFSFNFFISSVMHGSGRSSTDRQFFYINSRPCDPTKVIKLINEVYKQYNNNQYPFVYLNIISKSALVDVNVTPDKRQVFLEKEKVLLSTIKASLIDAFKSFPSTYKMQNLDLTQNTTINDYFESDNTSRGLKRSITDSGLKKGSILQKFKKRSKTENDKDSVTSPRHSFSSISEENSENSSLNNSSTNLDIFIKIASEICENACNTQPAPEPITKLNVESPNINEKIELNATDEKVEEIKIVCTSNPNKKEVDNIKTPEISKENFINENDIRNEEINKIKEENIVLDNDINISPERNLETNCKPKKVLQEEKLKIVQKNELKIVDPEIKTSLDMTVADPNSRKTVTWDISLDDIKKSLHQQSVTKEDDDIKVHFRSKINPESNKSAEEELRKHISKDDFANMAIIGQFNLGFIVTKLKNDLFIIDQHATDEKYNFEQLQANTVMENQILVKYYIYFLNCFILI